MRMYDIVEKKREGESLTEQEIDYFIQGYTNGDIPDYQVSALLMAIYFQGMTIEESAALTMSMVHSGEVLDLSNIHGKKVDKHSTGGVGDTTTLILAPLVASAGVSVAKMSGRGLGHTGGTIDKLESIDGFHVELSNERFIDLVNKQHLAVIGQSEQLVPADKIIYSLRDVTATVNSIPLIASSIMSKKIASGADAMVLDVKVGAGAFMKDISSANSLAKMMVDIGNRVGKETIAIISKMDQPLGYAVGNALEVEEAIETLQGRGPEDIRELSLVLGSHMIVLANIVDSLEEAYNLLEEKIQNGDAIEMFRQFIASQGGNPEIVEDTSLLPKAAIQHDILSYKEGYVTELLADKIGKAALLLGAGRETKDSLIDVSVGLIVHKKLGDYVTKGDRIFTIHASNENIKNVEKLLLNSIGYSDKQLPRELIVNTIK